MIKYVQSSEVTEKLAWVSLKGCLGWLFSDFQRPHNPSNTYQRTVKDNRFYVYSLVDPSTLEPFYIGKGSNGRIDEHFWESQADRNPHKWNKIQKLLRNGAERDDIVKKLATGLTEDKALELEAFLIEEIGLANLTNITEGGEQPPSHRGPAASNSKITVQEAAWIRYLVQNSNFGHKKLFNRYADGFESPMTRGIFQSIKQGKSWQHIEPEKPLFWDEKWETKVERRYAALCEWKTTDKSSAEVAEGCEFTKDQIKDSWKQDCFDLKTRFLEEHPEYLDKKQQKIERRYQAMVEWRTTESTPTQVSKKYGIKRKRICDSWYQDRFGLKTRFLEEHPTAA